MPHADLNESYPGEREDLEREDQEEEDRYYETREGRPVSRAWAGGMRMKNETLNIAPTWVENVNVAVTLLTHGDSEGRKVAVSELQRLAKFADKFIAQQESVEETIKSYEDYCDRLVEAEENDGDTAKIYFEVGDLAEDLHVALCSLVREEEKGGTNED